MQGVRASVWIVEDIAQLVEVGRAGEDEGGGKGEGLNGTPCRAGAGSQAAAAAASASREGLGNHVDYFSYYYTYVSVLSACTGAQHMPAL